MCSTAGSNHHAHLHFILVCLPMRSCERSRVQLKPRPCCCTELCLLFIQNALILSLLHVQIETNLTLRFHSNEPVKCEVDWMNVFSMRETDRQIPCYIFIFFAHHPSLATDLWSSVHIILLLYLSDDSIISWGKHSQFVERCDWLSVY